MRVAKKGKRENVKSNEQQRRVNTVGLVVWENKIVGTIEGKGTIGGD